MASNQGNPIAHRGLPACGRCYVAGDHRQKDCPACPNCRRHGHQQNVCPYEVDKPPCDHCSKSGHSAGTCPKFQQPQQVKCQVKGCDDAEPTWLHPHKPNKDNPLTAMQRATICGTNHVEKSTVAKSPKVATIHNIGNSKARTLTDCKSAIYGRQSADQSMLNGHNGDSVITNHVKLPKTPEVVYEYRIDIIPAPTQGKAVHQMTQRSERKRVFDSLKKLPVLADHKDYFTDYDTLWSCSELDQAQLANVDVEYAKQSGRMATVPSVTLFFLRTLNFGNGSVNLVGKATDEHNPNLLIKALNGMVTKCITERRQTDLFEASANSFYLKNSSSTLRDSLLINRGYFTSVRPGQKEPLLNVNIMHGTFLRPVVVSKFLSDMNPQYNGEAQKILQGRTVRIMYDRGTHNELDQDRESNRKKQIAGFGKVPRLQQFEDGSRMWTVKEWFESRGLPIGEPSQPCVNVGIAAGARPGATGALWIPAEYLEIEPHQTFGKMLSSKHMSEMLKLALKSPASNQAAIVEEGLDFLGMGNEQTQTALDKNYNFKIGYKLLQIPAQFLDPPLIKYAKSEKSGIDKASWDIAHDRFIRTPQAFEESLPLGVLDLRLQLGPPSGRIGMALLERCYDHGMLRNRPGQANIQFVAPSTKQFGPQKKQFSPTRENWDNFCKAVGGAWQKAHCPKFVLVLIDQNDPDLYAAIKLFADRHAGFKTVICTNEKVPQFPAPQGNSMQLNRAGNGLASIMSNLALKFNIKCGGQNHTVDEADKKYASGGQKHAVAEAGNKSAFAPLHTAAPRASGKLAMPGQKGKVQPTDRNHTDTMVIGVDVVHPGGDTPSIAAMVGTVDSHFANFCGSVRLQPGRVEILTKSNMQELFTERLAAFKAKTGKVPKRLLYYRDGVSEDQYYQVLSEEVDAIQKVLPDIAITAIVVGKRHHTRFFCAKEEDTYYQGKARSGNAKPGLLVDQVITQPDSQDGFKDFFLQPHAAIRGTAKSAHYIVIRNDKKCNWSMPVIYNLTHAFCYNYARATKGVSYCAPAYYADRLCDRMHRLLKLYMRAHDIGNWSMSQSEQQMIPKTAGGLAFRTRIAQEIDNDKKWKPEGRSNPWHPAMDNIMFWL